MTKTRKCIICEEDKDSKKFNGRLCMTCSNKKNYAKHRDKYRAQAKAKYWEDPIKARAQCRKRRADNPEKFKQYAKNVSYETNRRRWSNRYDKLKERPDFRVHNSIGSMIWQALNYGKNGRSWEKIVGYSTDDLMRHLENLFVGEMSWDNYGEWHIDHIIPKSFFVFSSISDVEFKMCWRLENLQPLWAEDNYKKSGKLNYVA